VEAYGFVEKIKSINCAEVVIDWAEVVGLMTYIDHTMLAAFLSGERG